MKTNVMLKSKDRELFGIAIKQETKTGFLSVSQLQEAYELARSQNGWSKRGVENIMQTDSFKKVIYHVFINKNIINTDMNLFYREIDKFGVVKTLKKLNFWKTFGRGKNKNTYCVDWIWRILYHNLFKNTSFISTPRFILEIDNYIEPTSIIPNKENSREISFIDKFIKSSSIFIDNHEKQFLDNGYRYDLKISILGVEFIIEYHEKQHKSTRVIENDYRKFKNLHNRYIYIVIPYNKEKEQIEYIKEILKKQIKIEKINKLEQFRYKSIVDSKYATAINNRVFGKHESGMRNLASSSELKQIAKIESGLSDNIEMGYITNDEQIMSFISKTRLVK